jgi:hypothetical protein
MNDPTPARVRFSGAGYLHSQGAWGFYTNDLPGGYLAASDLPGKTVNIGTKDGEVFDTTTVTGFNDRTGVLTLTGGQTGAAYRDGPPVPLVIATVWINDIARGYVHAPIPPLSQLDVLDAAVAKLNTARTIEDVIRAGAAAHAALDDVLSAKDETDAILGDPDTMAAIVEAEAEQGPVPAELARAADDAWDYDPNPNDPPSPAADLLDALIGDTPDRFPGMLLSDIADTCPGGIGEAAVVARDSTNARFLIVALPIESVLGKKAVKRAGVRRLLAERQPDLAAAVAATERQLEQALLEWDDDVPDNTITGVPMVCTACRKPVRQAPGMSAASVWEHADIAVLDVCPAPFGAPVMAMVAAGNENAPLAY